MYLRLQTLQGVEDELENQVQIFSEIKQRFFEIGTLNEFFFTSLKAGTSNFL
jgi:hypothetical protein